MAILIRPVREQFEHDRVVRELEVKLRRRYDVEANVGDEQRVSVRSSGRQEYPDLVLTSAASGRKSHAIVEVETAESVNRLEAMHEWVRFAKVRAAFHLYVPINSVDAALRLCKEHRIHPSEVWSFIPYGDQFRFTQVSPTPGIVEPEIDLEEVRAERRAALAEQAAVDAPPEATGAGSSADVNGVASKGAGPTAKPSRARRAATTSRPPAAPKAGSAGRTAAQRAAAAFSAAQAAKAGKGGKAAASPQPGRTSKGARVAGSPPRTAKAATRGAARAAAGAASAKGANVKGAKAKAPAKVAGGKKTGAAKAVRTSAKAVRTSAKTAAKPAKASTPARAKGGRPTAAAKTTKASGSAKKGKTGTSTVPASRGRAATASSTKGGARRPKVARPAPAAARKRR